MNANNCLVEWDINRKLYYFVDNRCSDDVKQLLLEGANATLVSLMGRSAIGHAAYKGYYDILKILLESCESGWADSVVKSNLRILDRDYDDTNTPEGMEGLQWEEEIRSNSLVYDDEWSKLYRYYAHMIEQTGDILSNTIKIKDPHCTDAFFHAPIHYSTVSGNYDCTKILLDHGSPVDPTTDEGFTPLHLAVQHPRIVQLLIDHGANVNSRTITRQETPLHLATRVKSIETVKLLIEYRADVNASCLSDKTPLILAVAEKNVDIVRELLKAGAKLNCLDAQGFTPLDIAVLMHEFVIAECLLQHGARLFISHYLIHYCLHNDLNDMAKMLIRYGDNVNVRDAQSQTPLLLAIKRHNHDLIDFLLERKAEAYGAIHAAIRASLSCDAFIKVVDILFKYNVRIDAPNYWGESPLLHAIMWEKYRMAEYLIRHGANVNRLRSDDGMDLAVLSKAVRNVDLFMLLVHAGLNVRQQRRTHSPISSSGDEPLTTEKYVSLVLSNPLSLQCLTRIVIRNRLIDKLKLNQNYRRTGNGKSKFHCFIMDTGLPISLQNYLYEFPDVPDIVDGPPNSIFYV